MKKYVKKGVAFIGMRHLFDRNATPKQRNATPFLKKKHYICTMKNIIEAFMKEEQAIFIVALCLLLFAIVMGYAMVQDYRIYLDENYKARISFRDFFKQEQFYIFLFLVSIFIMSLNLLYFLE